MNHGSYYHWWTIQERPFLFGVFIVCLVTSLLFIWGSIFWLWKQNNTKGQVNSQNVSRGRRR
jgi:hypothetical protein